MSVQSTLFMILFDLIMIFLKPKAEDLFVVVFCFPFFFFSEERIKMSNTKRPYSKGSFLYLKYT